MNTKQKYGDFTVKRLEKCLVLVTNKSGRMQVLKQL